MLSRSAIHASGIVVCERNSQASSIFLGSPFRRALRSASLQPIRFAGLPASLCARLCQRLQQPLPVLVILKDGLSPVAPIHHMIDRPRILNAHLPSHAPRLWEPFLRGQPNSTISLTVEHELHLGRRPQRPGKTKTAFKKRKAGCRKTIVALDRSR